MNGSFEVAASRAETYEFLTDPQRLVKALPDIQSASFDGPDSFIIDVKVGVGFLRGVMNLKMRLVDKQPNERAVFAGHGQGMGSSVDLEASYDLADAAGDGTQVNWYGDAKIGGRLASVAGGMLEPLAKKSINYFVESVRSALEEVSQQPV